MHQCLSCMFAVRDSPRGTVSGSETPNDRQAHEHCPLTKGKPYRFYLSIIASECCIGPFFFHSWPWVFSVSAIKSDLPVPLSTKMYYSQRNSRLRLALSHQYFVTSTKELCSDMVRRQESQQSTMLSQASYQGMCPLKQVDNLLIKKVCPC